MSKFYSFKNELQIACVVCTNLDIVGFIDTMGVEVFSSYNQLDLEVTEEEVGRWGMGVDNPKKS